MHESLVVSIANGINESIGKVKKHIPLRLSPYYASHTWGSTNLAI